MTAHDPIKKLPVYFLCSLILLVLLYFSYGSIVILMCKRKLASRNYPNERLYTNVQPLRVQRTLLFDCNVYVILKVKSIN